MLPDSRNPCSCVTVFFVFLVLPDSRNPCSRVVVFFLFLVLSDSRNPCNCVAVFFLFLVLPDSRNPCNCVTVFFVFLVLPDSRNPCISILTLLTSVEPILAGVDQNYLDDDDARIKSLNVVTAEKKGICKAFELFVEMVCSTCSPSQCV